MHKRQKILLVDMDGVMARYDKRYLERATEIGLERLDPEDVTNFYTEEIFKPEDRERLYDLSLEKGFFRNLEPYPGCIEALNELFDHPQLRVFICTAPKIKFDNCVGEKYEWVREHLGERFIKRMMVTRDKTIAYGDYLIDDKPQLSGALKRPVWQQIYHDRPYNRVEHGGNPETPRFSWENWREELGAILEIDFSQKIAA